MSSTLKLHTKHQLSGSLWVQQMGCYTIRNIIHCSWSISYPQEMHKVDRRCFYQYLSATYGSHCAISLQCQLSNCTQNARCWYPLSMTNEILYYKEGQPLLMKCFKTFLRCIMQMGDASDSIFLSFTGHTSFISTNTDSQIAHKMPEFLVPSQ